MSDLQGITAVEGRVYKKYRSGRLSNKAHLNAKAADVLRTYARLVLPCPLTSSDLDQCWQHIPKRRALRRPTKFEVQLVIKLVERIVDIPGFSLRLEDRMRWTNLPLRFVNGAKRSRRQECEDGRADSRPLAAWHQYRAAQHVGIDLLQHGVALR